MPLLVVSPVSAEADGCTVWRDSAERQLSGRMSRLPSAGRARARPDEGASTKVRPEQGPPAGQEEEKGMTRPFVLSSSQARPPRREKKSPEVAAKFYKTAFSSVPGPSPTSPGAPGRLPLPSTRSGTPLLPQTSPMPAFSIFPFFRSSYLSAYRVCVTTSPFP